MEIVYVYQRKRKEYGKQPLFRDRETILSTNILPDPSLSRNFVVRNPSNTEMQAGPDLSEHDANTESVAYESHGILHLQGGWPKDVDPTDVEHTIRYRKKIEKDEDYARVVQELGETVEHCIKQNNAIDIYQEYFLDNQDVLCAEPASAKSVNVFRDPAPTPRPASHLSWYPDSGHKLAVAYSPLSFQHSTPASLDSYIWDVENPNAPDQTLTPQGSGLVCLKYNPKDPHILVGGCYSGTLSYWDTRKGPYPADTTPVAKSHRDPVYGISWVQSKSGAEFFSCSTDGQVLWWDIRKMDAPTESLLLDPEKNGTVVGGTVVEFEATMATKFMVGSETGSIFLCNKKAKSANERIQHVVPAHIGPIYSLQRNPFFTKNFLSVGDWTTKLWFEDIKTPLLSTRPAASYLVDACWSPTRPAVFFTGSMDGTVDVWDLAFKQGDPVVSVQVSPSPIHSVKVQDHGKLLAVASRDGSTTVLELSEGLAKLQGSEKQTMSAMFEREAKREKTLEAAAREKRLKAQQAAAQGKRPGSGAAAAAEADADEELLKELEEADKDFWTTVGIVKKPNAVSVEEGEKRGEQ
ncbi:WD40 repeat-like protein [Gonapodya prolifera JEL478]|uniref:WD40 repeat-like protein n=1 Tax=Gonapodya prolifera (strain JEL478) TaxID=1344416 RepID=A0A139AJB9_GONPJ|nr:WD40 repeat-like protein [Gonapodya prolifera JEL478]|eukprot:KXS16505.1 WD40 repeat-like protein [Gonapodya prolifera JEL478]